MIIAIIFAIFIIAIILFNYIFITEVIDHISNMKLDLNNSKLLLEIEDYKNKIEELEKLNYELNEEFNEDFNELSIDYLKLIKNSEELEKLNYELNEDFNELSIDYLKLIKNSDEKLNIN